MGIPDFSCKCSNFWATKRKERSYAHPLGRKILLVGDLINRGPDSKGVLKIARNMHENGTALIILGNHELGSFNEVLLKKPLDDDSYEPYLSWIRSLPFLSKPPPFGQSMPPGTIHPFKFWKEPKPATTHLSKKLSKRKPPKEKP